MHYHPFTRYDAPIIEEGSDKERIFFITSDYLKDNKINAKSTRENCPTKRLDTVDSTTGRIIDTIPTLEINNITLIREETTGIGHSEHKRRY